MYAVKRIFDRQRDFKTKMYLHFPYSFFKNFKHSFALKSIRGFGFMYPPDGLSIIYSRHSKLFAKLKPIENFLCSHYPFYNFCDHYLLEMERK